MKRWYTRHGHSNDVDAHEFLLIAIVSQSLLIQMVCACSAYSNITQHRHTQTCTQSISRSECIFCDCFNFSAKYTNESQPPRTNRVAYYLFKIMYELLAFTDCQVKRVRYLVIAVVVVVALLSRKWQNQREFYCGFAVDPLLVLVLFRFFFLFMLGRMELSWCYSLAKVCIKNESDALMHFYLISFKLNFFLANANIRRRWTWVWVRVRFFWNSKNCYLMNVEMRSFCQFCRVSNSLLPTAFMYVNQEK